MTRILIRYRRPQYRELLVEAELLADLGDVIVTRQVLTAATQPVFFQGEKVLDNGFTAVFFEFTREYFDIARIYDPLGRFTGYYVDINTPSSRFEGGYETTDLFLDLWLAPDRRGFLVLDEEEFHRATAQDLLKPELAHKAREVLGGLIAQIGTAAFPPPIVDRFEVPPAESGDRPPTSDVS